jgi:hypothetical protein
VDGLLLIPIDSKTARALSLFVMRPITLLYFINICSFEADRESNDRGGVIVRWP